MRNAVDAALGNLRHVTTGAFCRLLQARAVAGSIYGQASGGDCRNGIHPRGWRPFPDVDRKLLRVTRRAGQHVTRATGRA
jgi:hypothetical protein